MKSKLPAVPYLLWMGVFTIVPFLLVIFFAFTDSSGRFTLDNLSGITSYIPVFGRSLWLALVATVICLVLAYPFAYIISRIPSHRQSIFYMLAILPMWMNYLLRTYAWMTILENNGLLNRFLGLFGIGPLSLINTQGAVVLGMVYDFIPFMILPLYSTMVKIDNSVVEAAQDLGASTWSVLARVILPLSVPGITTGITMVFVPSVSTFIISRMLGGGSWLMIGDLIEMQFLGNAYNPNLGSAISLVLMVIVLIIMSITNLFDDEEVGEMIK